MTKKKLLNVLNIALLVTITLAIFICFCPMLTFKAPQAGNEYLFALDGMSLLVKDSKAVYWDNYDTIILKGILFPKSNVMVASFVIEFIILIFTIATLCIKSVKNIDKIAYPAINTLALINIILSSLIFTTYPYTEITFSWGYGLYLYIVFNVLVFVAVSGLTFLSFSKLKKLKD